jgi:dienelactone hydrolase
MSEIAARGWNAVASDNRSHGDRSGPDFVERACAEGKWSLLAIRQMIQETAEDFRTVLDQMLLRPEIDRERIGVAGISMGAFAGLKALTLDNRIRATVSILGSPYWDDCFEGTLEVGDPKRRRLLAEYASANQPASFKEAFPPRAVLFQVGERDPHLDSARVMGFCRELEGAYAEFPYQLEGILFPDIAHEVTPPMWENTLTWFDRFL